MNSTKFDRVLGLLVSLLSREPATTEALALRYGVSVRTIYRDLRSLAEAGVPLTSMPGPGGGVDLVEGWALDRLLLRPEELDLVRQTMAGVARSWPDKAARSGTEKLAGLAQGRSGPEYLFLDLDPWSGAGDSGRLAGLVDACRNQRVIALDCRSGQGQTTSRFVEPLTLVWRAGRWYLFAWCRLRSECRLLRVDGISKVTLTAERFRRRSANYIDTIKRDEAARPRVRVTVRFSAAKAPFAPTDAEGAPFDDNQGRRTVRLDLAPGDVHAFCGSWGADLEVLAPPTLRDEFAAQAARMQSLYSSKNP